MTVRWVEGWGEPAGRLCPGEAQQSGGMRVDWSSTLLYHSADQESQQHRVGGIWPWPPRTGKARFARQGKPWSCLLAGSAQLEGTDYLHRQSETSGRALLTLLQPRGGEQTPSLAGRLQWLEEPVR